VSRLVHLVADYGPGDLAFSEVVQRLALALGGAVVQATPVAAFDTLAAGFCVAQLALTDGPDDRVRAVLEQMEAILRRQGVSRLGAAGEPFDPELHEAVAVQPSDELPDRAIVEIARSGFALGDRVVRPAQVVVARATRGEG
jgi:hypothetical protein